jgi:FkbM family methyltransferase
MMMQSQKLAPAPGEVKSQRMHSLRHHPVFYNFRRWRGFVPKGLFVNFLGVLTGVAVSRDYNAEPCGYVETNFPCFGGQFEEFEEYFEWIDLLEAVVAAEKEFTMMELGAGWGRWMVNAAAAITQYSGLPYRLIAVEAEPNHFRWMKQHARNNGLDMERVHLVEAAVDEQDGTAGFHMTDSSFGGPADWYGQCLGGSSPVRAVSLNTLLEPLQSVDLIDLDIQGAELKVLRASIDQLQKVKRLHIATHNREVEVGLRELFTRLGWTNLRDYPSLTLNKTDYGYIKFQDGIQSWQNPRLASASSTRITANHLADTAGFVLEIDPKSKRSCELLEKGILDFDATELISRIVRDGDICVDTSGEAYFVRLMAKLCGTSGTVIAAGVAAENRAMTLTPSPEHEEGQVVDAQNLDAIANILPANGNKLIRLLYLDISNVQLAEGLQACLQRFLSGYLIDFMLVNGVHDSSQPAAKSFEKIFLGAGYSLWQYHATEGCLPASTISAEGDCYLFSRAEVANSLPNYSLTGSFRFANFEYDRLANINRFLNEALETQQRQNEELRLKVNESQQKVEALQQQLQTAKLMNLPKIADAAISPAAALWNQREKLASMRPRIEQLHAAVASPGELSLYQWAQLTAIVLEYRPDLIIELGRGIGNSTACFLETAHQLGAEQCKIVSVCLDPRWKLSTVERLKPLVPQGWFDAGHIVEENILTFDFQSALEKSKRCLIFWDAHGFEVAECVLGGILPQLVPREHLVLMHDFSDLRYSSPDPSYETNGLWKGESAEQPALWLSWIFSRVPQSISVLDFTTRNNVALFSADESLHREIANNPQKAAALQAALGSEMASLQSHWFWFTLNGAQQNLTFPYFSSKAAMERFELKAAFDAAPNSLGWRLLRRWWKLAKFLAPPESLRRRGVECCLHPLRKLTSKQR